MTNYIENHVLVSIIIPVFNTASYLYESLYSVTHQTHNNLEIIVIDDGSTDESSKICDEFSQNDDRIYVMHTKNNGLSAARNIGVRHAKGTFILFLDSDDWIAPNTIETMLITAFQAKADVVVADSIAEYVDRSVHPQREQCVKVYRDQDILSAYAEGKLRDVVWNKLYANSCFSLLLFPEGHYYEDVDVTWKLMRHLADNCGIVVKIPEELFHQRVRKSSISHARTFCTIVDCWKAYYGKFEALPEYKDWLIPGCVAAISRMWPNYNGFSKAEKKKANTIIREMCDFSRKYRRNILTGDYNQHIKKICLISQSRSHLLMWLMHHGGRIHRMFMKTKNVMFD